METLSCRHIAFNVTLKCTLKCEKCLVGIPYYSDKQRVTDTTESLENQIHGLFSIIDFVEKFTLTGGEPLANHNLDALIECAMKFSNQFNILEISTNGTLLPSDKLRRALKNYKDKMFVLIDNYGELSPRANEFETILTELGVNHLLRNYTNDSPHLGGWVDFGDFSQEQYSDDEVCAHFKSCTYANKHTLSVLQGKLFPCCRVRVYNDLVAPVQEKLYVEIIGKDNAASKQKVRDLLALEHWEVCKYCIGMTPVATRVVPAIQKI